MHHSRHNRRSQSTRLSFERLEARQMLAAAQLIDLNTEPLGNGPGAVAALGDDVYFQQDGKLWRISPGEETHLVVDQHSVSPEGLWQVGGRLLYRAADGIWSFDPLTSQSTQVIPPVNLQPSFFAWGNRLVVDYSNQLWLTDGTLAGTKQSLTSTTSLFASYWTELGNELLFMAYHETLGKELWKIDSNGDAEFVKDIREGASSSGVLGTMVAGGWMYFAADDGVHGSELWRSDGTEANTTLVADIYTGTSNVVGPSNLRVLGDYVYFTAQSLQYGRELYRTRASTGATTLAADVLPGMTPTGVALSSSPQELLVHNGSLYFVASDNAGRKPMRYDPQAGTILDLAPGAYWEHMLLYEAGEALYFLGANRGVNTGHYLDWQVIISDGTVAGTFAAATPTLSRETTWPTVYDGGAAGLTLTFLQSGEHAVWRATPSGVSEVGIVDVNLSRSTGFRVGNYRVLGFTSSTAGWNGRGDLWAVNLTSNSLERLGVFHKDTRFYEAAGRVYFTGWDGEAGYALWSTDGTASGTMRVEDLDPRTANSIFHSGRGTIVFNGERYFGLGNNGAELWASDGTQAGTRLVAYTGTELLKDLTVIGDSLYFIGGRPNIIGNPSQLWRLGPSGVAEQVAGATAERIYLVGNAGYLEGTIDGVRGIFRNTGGGFVLMHAAYQIGGANGTFGGSPVQVGNKLFYNFDNIYGADLYVRDLDTGVRTKLASLHTIAWMSAFGEGVVFGKRDNSTGPYDMWYSDGTVAGTREFTEFVPAHENTLTYSRLLEHDGYVYYRVETAEYGSELWRSRGTAESGELVADLRPGTVGSSPSSFHLLGDRIVFTANDGVHGREWWVIDDSESAPRLLIDIYAGTSNGIPSTEMILRSGDYVYFTGNDPNHGYEAWRTDGTAAGTIRLHDVKPGPGNSEPRAYSVVGNTLMFHADDGVHGRELWSIALDSIPLAGDYDGNGSVEQADYGVWKGYFGATSGAGLAADGNHDGVVDAADYTVWRDNLGRTMAGGGGAAGVAALAAEEGAGLGSAAASRAMAVDLAIEVAEDGMEWMPLVAESGNLVQRETKPGASASVTIHRPTGELLLVYSARQRAAERDDARNVIESPSLQDGEQPDASIDAAIADLGAIRTISMRAAIRSLWRTEILA